MDEEQIIKFSEIKKIIFDELELNKHDASSALAYIEKNSNENEYCLCFKDESIIEELIKKLENRKIEYFYQKKSSSLKLNMSMDTKKNLMKSILCEWQINFEYLEITNIDLRYLFGYIRYNLEIKDNLIAIHAPNGYGKSTLIKCLNYIYLHEYENLFKQPFLNFKIRLKDRGSQLDKPYTFDMEFINGDEKYIKFNKSIKYINFFKFSPDILDLCELILKYIKIQINHIIIHNIDDFDKYNEIKIRSNISTNLECGNIEEFEDTIDLYNKLIKEYFEEEKIVYLEKKYYQKDNDLVFNFKESLVIKNNITPIKSGGNIFKKGDIIHFEELSSGEQYILFVLYILRVYKNNTLDKTQLFIIDEPELNLHIEWQQILIKSINDIINTGYYYDPYFGKKAIKCIIASHSPYIINYPNINVGRPEYETE